MAEFIVFEYDFQKRGNGKCDFNALNNTSEFVNCNTGYQQGNLIRIGSIHF